MRELNFQKLTFSRYVVHEIRLVRLSPRGESAEIDPSTEAALSSIALYTNRATGYPGPGVIELSDILTDPLLQQSYTMAELTSTLRNSMESNNLSAQIWWCKHP